MADPEVENRLQQMSDFRKLMLMSIISALSFVVGLFWNDAIKTTIEQLVPQGDSLYYKYLAAVIVTVAVVVTIYVIMHGQRMAEKRIQELTNEIDNLARKKKKKSTKTTK